MFAATAMSAQTEQTDTVKIVNNADRVTVTQTGSDTKVQIIHNNDSGSFSVYEYAVSETQIGRASCRERVCLYV